MTKEKFLIEGLAGRRVLEGEVAVFGAKNEALKLMAAAILFKDKVSLKNVPEIEDVHRMADLLEGLGVSVVRPREHRYIFSNMRACATDLPADISKHIRASIVLTGPILARFGKVRFPHPGGCVIGKRPIDLFLEGFEKLGAQVKAKDDCYIVKACGGKLRGGTIFLRNQSVTATETFMMAATLARGKTVIKNASMEPEVVSLARFLSRAGAKITGAGTPTIEIRGGKLLASNGAETTVMPDRIEAGSFLILGALAAKKLVIRKCVPEHLEALIEVLRDAGVHITTQKNTIIVEGVKAKTPYRGVDIKTHEYPGFPTDIQAPMTVFLTQTLGESLVFETIFEGRLNYVESLSAMGADITVMDAHRVLVRGPKKLHGKILESPDLRAGLAFVIAAIIARGSSVIYNVYNIDRGYEKIEKRLERIGVRIMRVGEDTLS